MSTTGRDGPDLSRAFSGPAERLLAEMRIIHEASQRLHRLRDAESLVRDVIGLLQEIVVHDYGAVYLIDGEALSTFAVSDRGLGEAVLNTDKQYLGSLDLRVGKNVTGWVALHDESVLIADVVNDPRYLDSRPGIRSEICVPMRSQGRVMGVINLESTVPAAYTNSDRRVLEIVASQIAIAIENSRLHAQTTGFQRLRMMQNLTAGIVHDLGNLLLVAGSAIDRITEDQPGERSERNAEQANVAIDKCAELTHQLLKLERPDSDDNVIADLNAVVEATLPLLDVMAGPDLTVTLRRAPKPCRVAARGPSIEHILMNLVVNAREAGAARFEVWIRPVSPGDKPEPASVNLRITDDGRGMDEDTQSRALEPYFSTRADGRGIGLSSVARLVEGMNGVLSIHSSPGAGTTFDVNLPRR